MGPWVQPGPSMAAAAAATLPGSGRGAEGATAAPQEDEDVDCVICFESLDSRGGAVPLPCECRVAYCHHCWDRALAASMSACGRALCPSCRSAMQVDFDAESGRLLFSRAPATTSSSSSWFSELSEETEEHWRQRLYQQAKPLQIALLQQYGAEATRAAAAAAAEEDVPASGDREGGREGGREGEGAQLARAAESPEGVEPPRCVCGARLACTSARERVLAFVAEAPMPTPPSLVEHLMMRPPIVCDICSGQVEPRSRVWTCENGRRTVLHAVRYDVCEACFAFYAFGVEVPSDTGEGDDASEDPYGEDSATSDEEKDDW